MGKRKGERWLKERKSGKKVGRKEVDKEKERGKVGRKEVEEGERLGERYGERRLTETGGITETMSRGGKVIYTFIKF